MNESQYIQGNLLPPLTTNIGDIQAFTDGSSTTPRQVQDKTKGKSKKGKPREEAEQRSLQRTDFYDGILPPPEMLAEYEKNSPGSSTQFLSQFIKCKNHQMEIENKKMDIEKQKMEIEKQEAESSIFLKKQGLNMGFIITILFLFVSCYLIINGHEDAGKILGTVNVVAIISIFVLRKYSPLSKSQLDNTKLPNVEEREL